MPLNYSVRCECCGKFAKKEDLTLNFSLIKIYYCGPQLVSYLTDYTEKSFYFAFSTLFDKCMASHDHLEFSESVLLYYLIFNHFDQNKKMAEESYIVFC